MVRRRPTTRPRPRPRPTRPKTKLVCKRVPITTRPRPIARPITRPRPKPIKAVFRGRTRPLGVRGRVKRVALGRRRIGSDFRVLSV